MGALPGRRGLTQLPRGSARGLRDAARSLPADLSADPTAVVRAVRRGERADVEAWVKAVAGAAVIEVPLKKNLVQHGPRSACLLRILRGPSGRREGVMPTGIAPTKDIRTQMIRSEQTVVAASVKWVLSARDGPRAPL